MSRHIFTKDELDFVRGCAYGHSYKEIAQAFNEKFPLVEVDETKIKSCLANHKITTGRTGRFEKGHEPTNKGKHTITTGRMAETQFKKGNVPQNHLPVGSVRVRRSYKGRNPYVWEKVEEPNVWRMKHVLEWERENGPVPKDKIVIFADGDTLNTDISNLLLVSRSQLAVMNRWNLKGGNREYAEAGANIASLKIQISKSKKKRRAQ